MKRVVFALSAALVLSLVMGSVLIASAAAPAGLQKLSQAIASVKQAIGASDSVQVVSASGLRDTALSGQLSPEQIDGETFKQPKGGEFCDGSGGSGGSGGTTDITATSEISGTTEMKHPKGEKLATEFGVEYTEIMDWFCQGYGFGEISHAYDISKLKGVTVDEVFEMRASGMGWGKIKQFYGLIGKDAHPKNGNGSGNGNNGNNGNQGTNGKKNGGNNGNGKGKGNTK